MKLYYRFGKFNNFSCDLEFCLLNCPYLCYMNYENFEFFNNDSSDFSKENFYRIQSFVNW